LNADSTSSRCLSFNLVWSLVAASREVLLGKQNLQRLNNPSPVKLNITQEFTMQKLLFLILSTTVIAASAQDKATPDAAKPDEAAVKQIRHGALAGCRG